MNTARKGARAEHKARRALEAQGYVVTRAAASKGIADLIAIGPSDIILVQVKAGGGRMSKAEREAFAALPVPGNCLKQAWIYADRRPVRVEIVE